MQNENFRFSRLSKSLIDLLPAFKLAIKEWKSNSIEHTLHKLALCSGCISSIFFAHIHI